MKFRVGMFMIICVFSLAWCGDVEDRAVLQDGPVVQESISTGDENYVDEAEKMCLSDGWTYELFYSEEEWNYSKCTFENWATWVDYKDFGDFFEN